MQIRGESSGQRKTNFLSTSFMSRPFLVFVLFLTQSFSLPLPSTVLAILSELGTRGGKRYRLCPATQATRAFWYGAGAQRAGERRSPLPRVATCTCHVFFTFLTAQTPFPPPFISQGKSTPAASCPSSQPSSSLRTLSSPSTASCFWGSKARQA